MIIKPYKPTHFLEPLNGLMERLSSANSKRQELENEYLRIKAGNLGEKVIMELLEQLQLSHSFYIFHDLSLFLESRVQIDVFCLTEHYGIIFEIKNIKGAINLRQNPSQLVRTLPTGEIHVFNSPEPQVEEYVHQFRRFFLNQGIDFPIYGAVIFPFSTSCIKQTSTRTTILVKNEVKTFIRNLPTGKEFLTSSQLEYLCRYFLGNHQDFNPYPLINRYHIPRNSVRNGVACPNCKTFGMKRVALHWFCTNCFYKSSNAHEQAIYDYLKMINPSITNTECRHFLGIDNPNQAYRFLQSMNLKKIGGTRSACYILPDKDG